MTTSNVTEFPRCAASPLIAERVKLTKAGKAWLSLTNENLTLRSQLEVERAFREKLEAEKHELMCLLAERVGELRAAGERIANVEVERDAASRALEDRTTIVRELQEGIAVYERWAMDREATGE